MQKGSHKIFLIIISTCVLIDQSSRKTMIENSLHMNRILNCKSKVASLDVKIQSIFN